MDWYSYRMPLSHNGLVLCVIIKRTQEDKYVRLLVANSTMSDVGIGLINQLHCTVNKLARIHELQAPWLNINWTTIINSSWKRLSQCYAQRPYFKSSTVEPLQWRNAVGSRQRSKYVVLNINNHTISPWTQMDGKVGRGLQRQLPLPRIQTKWTWWFHPRETSLQCNRTSSAARKLQGRTEEWNPIILDAILPTKREYSVQYWTPWRHITYKKRVLCSVLNAILPTKRGYLFSTERQRLF